MFVGNREGREEQLTDSIGLSEPFLDANCLILAMPRTRSSVNLGSKRGVSSGEDVSHAQEEVRNSLPGQRKQILLKGDA